MLRLVHLEEIKDALLDVPELINRIEKADNVPVQQVKNWLVKLETILANNKMPEASKVGSMRGAIVSAEMGIVPAEMNTQKTLTRSKLKNGTALHVLRKIPDLIFDLIQKDLDRISESEKIMSQVLAVARSKELLKDIPNERSTGILKAWWSRLAQDNNVVAGVISIEGLMGPFDSLILFDRALGRSQMLSKTKTRKST